MFIVADVGRCRHRNAGPAHGICRTMRFHAVSSCPLWRSPLVFWVATAMNEHMKNSAQLEMNYFFTNTKYSHQKLYSPVYMDKHDYYILCNPVRYSSTCMRTSTSVCIHHIWTCRMCVCCPGTALFPAVPAPPRIFNPIRILIHPLFIYLFMHC